MSTGSSDLTKDDWDKVQAAQQLALAFLDHKKVHDQLTSCWHSCDSTQKAGNSAVYNKVTAVEEKMRSTIEKSEPILDNTASYFHIQRIKEGASQQITNLEYQIDRIIAGDHSLQ